MIDFPETMVIKGARIGFSIHCPTWAYYRTGWRKAACRVPIIGRIFRKYTKQEKDRVFYMANGTVVCSPENYEWVRKNGLPEHFK